jgi:outer membrane protein OmpA-like peptidoglycan-associated protein
MRRPDEMPTRSARHFAIHGLIGIFLFGIVACGGDENIQSAVDDLEADSGDPTTATSDVTTAEQASEGDECDGGIHIDLWGVNIDVGGGDCPGGASITLDRNTVVELGDGVEVPLGDVVDDLGGKDTDEGIEIDLPSGVLFDFNSAAIRPDAEPELEKVAAILGAYAEAEVVLTGHTDSVGSDADNQRLSDQRAESVRDELVQQHQVETARLTTEGKGEKEPVAPNENPDGSDNPAGREQNRRVEVLVLGANL